MPEPTFDNKDKTGKVDFSKIKYTSSFQPSFADEMSTPRSMAISSSSQYDPGFVVPEKDPYRALEDYRAAQQDWTAKWANGITKAGVTALTSAAESTFGVVYGIGAVLGTTAEGDTKGSAFYDNSFTRSLDAINKSVAEAMPNYYSTKAKEYGLLKELTTANFWSDKFMNGVGYMAGSIAAGYGLGKLASISKLVGTEAALLNAYDKAGDVTEGINKLAKNYRITNSVDFAKNAVFMSVGESGVEARQAKDEVRDKLARDYRAANGLSDDAILPKDIVQDIENRAEAAGNTAFGVNLAITSIENALMFPKIIGPGYASNAMKINTLATGLDYTALRAEAGLAKSEAMKAAQLSGKTLQEAEKIGQQAYNSIVKTKVLGSTTELEKASMKGIVGRNALYESTQEGLQFTTEKGVLDYYGRKYDPSAKSRTDSVLTSIVEGLRQTLGTKEGLESILLGALIGAPSALIGGGEEVRNQNNNSKAVMDTLNSEKLFKLQNQVDNFVRQDSYSKQKEDALNVGDMFEYQNAKFGEAKSTIKNVIDRGGTEALLNKLDAMKGLTEEEYKALTGYAPDFKLDKSVGEIIEEQKKIVNQLKETNDQVEIALRNPFNFKQEEQDYKNFEALKLKVWDTMTNLTNLDEREKSINERISRKSTKVIDILQSRNNAINFDQGDFDLYLTELKDIDTSLKLDIEEVKKQYKEKYLKEYKAKVDNLKKNDPVLYDSIRKDLDDLGKIVNKREELIDNYNKLTNAEKLKKNLNDIASQENRQTPEGALDSSAKKEAFRAEAEAAGYKTDGSEAITLEINGKRVTLYFGIDKDTKQKGWLINGKKADLKTAKYKIISKDTIAREKAERVQAAKDTVREKQITNQINAAKQKRDNLLSKIFEANEKKILREKEADQLLADYQAGKLKITQEKLMKLLDNLQKDIFAMQDWIDKNEPLLPKYDEEIAGLQDKLKFDPSIESVIAELDNKKKEAEWLANEVDTVKKKITVLNSAIRKLRDIFKQLFPNAYEILNTWTSRYPGAEKRYVYEGTPEYQEVKAADIEIRTKQDALKALKQTLKELEIEQQNTQFEIERLTKEVEAYNNEVGNILQRQSDRLDGSQLTSLSAVEVNTASGTVVADDFRQSNMAKASFLTTSGRHFIDDKETTDPSQRRWFRTVDKLPNPADGKNLFFVQFFTADHPTLGQYFTDREKKEYPNAIKSILLDATGKPVLADENGNITDKGQPVYTPIHEPSFIFDEAKYKAEGKASIKLSHNHLVGHYLERVLGYKPGEGIPGYPLTKTVNGVKYTYKSADEILEAAARLYAKELEDFRNHILANLKAGKNVYSTVTGKSNGIPNYIRDSNNQKVRNPIVTTFVKTIKDIARIVVPTSRRDTKISTTATVVPGTVYVVGKNGKFVDVDNRNLTDNEVTFLVDLLDFALNTTGDINKQVKAKDSDNYYDIFLTKGGKDEAIVNKLIFYGKPKDATKTTGREIYFTGYGENRMLHFGDKVIPAKDIKTSEELKAFLKDKRLNVNRNLLGRNNKFFQPRKFSVNSKGVAEVEFKIWDAADGLGGYEQYLLEKKVISTSISRVDDETKPQFKGTYLSFSKTLLNDISEPPPTKKTAAKGAPTASTTVGTKTVTKSKTLEASDLKNLNVGDEITMTRKVPGTDVIIKLQYTANGLVGVDQFNNGKLVPVSPASQTVIEALNVAITSGNVELADRNLTLEEFVEYLNTEKRTNMTIEVAETSPATPGATPFGSYTAEDETEGGSAVDTDVEARKKVIPKKVKEASGWKLRFNIKATTDQDYEAKAKKLSEWLDDYFGTTKRQKQKGNGYFAFKEGSSSSVWKHLAGGEKGESDFTIYIGSKKDAIKFARQVEESEIKDLITIGIMGEDTLIGNIVKGRFDSKEFKYLAPNINILKKSLEEEGLSKNGEFVTETKSGIKIVITDGKIIYSTDGGKTFKDYKSSILSDTKNAVKVRDQIIEDIYGDDYTGNNAELAALEGKTAGAVDTNVETRRKELKLDNVLLVAEPTQAQPYYTVVIKGENFDFLAYVDKGSWTILPKQKNGYFSASDPKTGNALIISNEESKKAVEKYLPKELIDLIEESDKQNTYDKQRAFEKGPIAEYVSLYRKEYLQEIIPQEEEILEYFKSDKYPNSKDSQKRVVKSQEDKIEKLKKELAALEGKTAAAATVSSTDPLANLRGVFSAALPTLSDPIEVVTDHYNTYLDEYQAAGMSLESLLESWRNNKGDFNDSPEEFITSEITRLGCKPR